MQKVVQNRSFWLKVFKGDDLDVTMQADIMVVIIETPTIIVGTSLQQLGKKLSEHTLENHHQLGSDLSSV